METFALRPIGRVESPVADPADAAKQGDEGAPEAWLAFRPEVAAGLRGVGAGAELLLLTWLHRADRDVLLVHPRGDPTRPLTGVFATRSPHRPNPLGLHRVTAHQVVPGKLKVGPLEAIDGTPVVDIKPVLCPSPDR